jgi:hypothetical protein
MAQHDDLEILGSPRPEPQGHQFEHAPGQDVQQRWQHVVGASKRERSGRRDDGRSLAVRLLLGRCRRHLPIVANPLIAGLTTG